MEDIKTITIGIIVFLVVVCTLAFFAESIGCHSQYSEYKSEYGIFSGCRVEWNGKMTPIDIIREIN